MAKTVFILGAGASCPYGFPSGQGLVDGILKNLTPYTYNNQIPFYNATQKLASILKETYGAQSVYDFKYHLEESETSSIDSFLTENSKFRDIGKMCIAYILLEFENLSLQGNKLKGDWYKYFWGKINNVTTEKYNFSIYSFNYDRSLEFYLRKVAKSFYGIEGKELDDYMSSIEIQHLHGSLGEIPYGDIEEIQSKRFSKLKKVSENIDIIYEVNLNQIFRNLRNEILTAEHVVFLGFGFHPDNMRRIGLKEIEYDNIPEFYASTYLMEDAEVNTLISRHIDFIYQKYENDPLENAFDDNLLASNASSLDFLRSTYGFENMFDD